MKSLNRQFHSMLLLMGATMMASPALAEAPEGYYDSCHGKSGAQLLASLQPVAAQGHDPLSYNGLWNLFKISDVDANGKIWDKYSDIRWRPGSDQCGSYSTVGDCYNREHSMPKSWFDDATPMYTDAFHMYPTDGYVNGRRSNYPFGECSGGTVYGNGRLGRSSYQGYSGTVFEPDDEYKGDFARTYFYMAARYNDRIATWDSDQLAGNAYPAFTSWSVSMFMKWHRQDPVSEKELDRQEVVYREQGNRNPFIDCPDLAEHIWGDAVNTPWDEGTGPAVLASPVDGQVVDFGVIATGKNVSRTIAVEGTNFTEHLTVTLTGAAFTVSATTITADDINEGTELTVTCSADVAGSQQGSLRLYNSIADVTLSLTANVVDGLPARQATDITEESFTANWQNIATDPNATFMIYVKKNGAPVSGYPRSVTAADESYRVDGLTPGTTYTYSLTYSSLVSNEITVTTHDEMPSLDLLPESDLIFYASVGTPSDYKVITIDGYKLTDDIRLEVQAPFELSTDLHTWGATATADRNDDHFYLRVNPTDGGEFSTSIRATSGDLFNDDLTAQAQVSPSGLTSLEQARQSWEAYCLNGSVVIDNFTDSSISAAIYTTDAATIWTGSVNPGLNSFDLPAGIYIVVVNNASRRVIIK